VNNDYIIVNENFIECMIIYAGSDFLGHIIFLLSEDSAKLPRAKIIIIFLKKLDAIIIMKQ
jgi:CRISPR/Cas system CSM-associated protein Csm3 (group 7 of RAMP superfamily)